MKVKRFGVIILSLAMILSLTACSYSDTQKKYMDTFDKMGFTKVKDYDACSYNMSTGVYLSTSKKEDIESFCKNNKYFDAADTKSIVVGMKSSTTSDMFMAVSVDFENESAGKKLISDMRSQLDGYDNARLSNGLISMAVESDDTSIKAGIYYMGTYIYYDITVNGTSATVIATISASDLSIVATMNIFYDEIGEKSPSELLKETA